MNRGIVTVEVTSADPGGLLDAMLRRGIGARQIRMTGQLTMEMILPWESLAPLREFLAGRGEDLRILNAKRWIPGRKTLARHSILLLGMTVLLLASLLLPERIWFFQVEGTEALAPSQILEAAEAAGLKFGCSRREIRSETIKNRLLEAIPQLQWVGINTRGCVVVITVRERSLPQTSEGEISYSSLVASRDGVIVSSTVTAGAAQCQVGQAVKAGEVLVSGMLSETNRVRARGEILALTQRLFQAKTPGEVTSRREITRRERKYALLLGKNLINFSKDSGIPDTTCDKMYVYHEVILPGGFRLPVALVEQTLVYYRTETAGVEPEAGREILSAFVRQFLREQMIAGQVLTAGEAVRSCNGGYQLLGVYGCREMIGLEIQEKME